MSEKRYLIDRAELPYDAFVADPSWLCPVEGQKKAPAVKCVLIHDNFQNYKGYSIPKAQLVIADIPYNIGTDFYASRPDWYVDGDNKNGESSKARKAAFNTDFTFNIAEYFAFCNRLLKKEPKTGEKDAPCMIVFCAFQQIPEVIRQAEKYYLSPKACLGILRRASVRGKELPEVLKKALERQADGLTLEVEDIV